MNNSGICETAPDYAAAPTQDELAILADTTVILQPRDAKAWQSMALHKTLPRQKFFD